MRLYISLDRDEIQRTLPYAIIGETASCAIWDTGKRKRLFVQTFTEQERETCYWIIKLAKKWLLKTGVPDDVKMRFTTLALWHRLAEFCAML